MLGGKELSLNLATASTYDNRPFLTPFEFISRSDSIYPVSSLAPSKNTKNN